MAQSTFLIGVPRVHSLAKSGMIAPGRHSYRKSSFTGVSPPQGTRRGLVLYFNACGIHRCPHPSEPREQSAESEQHPQWRKPVQRLRPDMFPLSAKRKRLGVWRIVWPALPHTVNVSLAIYVSCHGVVRRTARDRLCGLTERLFKGTYYMITAAALIITGIATIAVVALLCIAVYDPARTAGMSLKQRAAFCLRQLSSSWPWR